MSITELTIELSVDIFAIILGIKLIVITKDNMPRLYWGFIAIIIGLFFTLENIHWIHTNLNNPNYEYVDILNIEKMLKWFAPATIVSLFPVASLRPGYLNFKRVIVYLLPFLCVFSINFSYLLSEAPIYKIHTIQEAFLHFDKFDIKLRIITFVISIIIPLTYFLYPVLSKKTYRKIGKHMYVFLGFNFILLLLYILFTININTFIFNAFGIISILFTITVTYLFLVSENPFSVHIGNTVSNHKIDKLFHDVENFMLVNLSFTHPEYSIQQLAESLHINETKISNSIKSAGYTGFREYLNNLRLLYFKKLVIQKPESTIKELMYECGFTSRTTFYRIFAKQFGLSPVEYQKSQINNLSK